MDKIDIDYREFDKDFLSWLFLYADDYEKAYIDDIVYMLYDAFNAGRGE